MNDHQPKISNAALTARLLLFAVGMFAFGFLVLPPLYDVFCDITGFGGRTNSTAVTATGSGQPTDAASGRIVFQTSSGGDIYVISAGAVDKAGRYGRMDSDAFRRQFPNGFDSICKKAKAMARANVPIRMIGLKTLIRRISRPCSTTNTHRRRGSAASG